MRTTFNKMACHMIAAVALGASVPAHALMINLTSTGNASADAGFQAAANFWQSVFVDPVTVNITAGFAALAPTILGSASSTVFDTSFSAMKTALAADATSADDAIMVAGLPGGSSYSKYINRTIENAGAEHVLSGITDLWTTSANAKAMGLLAGDNAEEDAAITFSSNFVFDFDPSDGIAAGMYDFIGLAIHELGHALGFVSGVDILDYYGRSLYHDVEYNPFASVLDFTRCSAASEAAGADIDWRAGRDAKDFSIDGSCSGDALVVNAWSTGRYLGDGRQASHWKDQLGLGIMDPTFASGELGKVTSLDILALDVIGWDRANAVPEPSSLLLAGAALLGMGAVRRRRQAA